MEPDERIAALIIASDEGDGFVGPKYLASYGRTALLNHVLEDARTWPVDEVYVVLGAYGEEVMAGLDLGSAVVVLNPDWAEGEAASLRVGLDALSRDRSMRLAVLARGDQPGVSTEVVRRLLDERDVRRALAAVPKFRYARGWPIVVSEELWPRLIGLEGDIDVLDVLASHPDGVAECWFDELEPHRIERSDDLHT